MFSRSGNPLRLSWGTSSVPAITASGSRADTRSAVRQRGGSIPHAVRLAGALGGHIAGNGARSICSREAALRGWGPWTGVTRPAIRGSQPSSRSANQGKTTSCHTICPIPSQCPPAPSASVNPVELLLAGEGVEELAALACKVSFTFGDESRTGDLLGQTFQGVGHEQPEPAPEALGTHRSHP